MVKNILLFYLFLSSAYISAELGEDKLEKLMRDNFGVSATPENILSARNEQGESVLHVIYREVVKAPTQQEISSLAEANDEIPEKIGYELARAVDQEGNPLIAFVAKIVKENGHTGHAIDKVNIFSGYVKRYKNIRRPRTPCEGCSWQQRALWAGGTAVGTIAVIVAIAYKLDFKPIQITLGINNAPNVP